VEKQLGEISRNTNSTEFSSLSTKVQARFRGKRPQKGQAAQGKATMQEILVFDVDGTLTPPQSMMEEPMARLMRQTVLECAVYLVTGSDRAKLLRQVPADIAGRAEGVFCASGNELWRGARLIYQKQHAFPAELVAHAWQLLNEAQYATRTGNHIEARTGSLNISVIGRNANMLQRRDYARHDKAAGERARIAAAIMSRFPGYEANCGGQISIDIAPRGWNKGRVVQEILARSPNRPIRFFGDTIREGGNDLPLAKALEALGGGHVVHAVTDHRETLKLLEALMRRRDLSNEVA
jgi:phosphomannomutase